MNDDIFGDASQSEIASDWKRLRAMTDDEVHDAVALDPDIAPHE
jgi:hypothetical protein